MRRFVCQWLAISSVLAGALLAGAETRPQYGGTLHVAMRAAPSSLDPGDPAQPDSFARRTITSLLFDNLVTVDQNGRAIPVLAQTWQAARGSQRLQFRLRGGVRFQDGTLLNADTAASSLRRVNPSWNIVAEGDSVWIDSGRPEGELLQELALPRNAIVKRDSEDKLSGTGPFQIEEWQAGRQLILVAVEQCWRGRPFLDGVEIDLGMGFRDQMNALETGKADLVEVAPEQTSRISQERFRVARSIPVELLALVFTREPSSEQETTLRQALRFSMERSSMHSVLLQGAGQASGALLPTWMSAYGFVFPTDADLVRARQLREQVKTVPAWTLGYENNDPLARLLADRAGLNARDAGLSLRPIPSGNADLRLTRIPLASSDPWIALNELLAQLGLPTGQSKGRAIEDLYATEQAVLTSGRVIPLFHLPASYASASGVKSWVIRGDGSLDLSNAWMKSGQP
jgi:ABC-type transport system substrate-binding protein